MTLLEMLPEIEYTTAYIPKGFIQPMPTFWKSGSKGKKKKVGIPWNIV